MVMADGFAWNGQTYDSLSKVAFAITGTKWNGPRFFGLRDKEDQSAKGGPAMKANVRTLKIVKLLTFEAEDRVTRNHADMDAFAVEYIAVHDRPPIEVPHAKGCACWAAIARQIALGYFPFAFRLLGRLLARVLREDQQDRIHHGPYRLRAN